MPGTKKKYLVKKAKALMEDSRLTDELAEMIEQQRGDLGFLLRTLKGRPRTFNPFAIRGKFLFKEPHALDRKTAELVAISAATAYRCEHCLEAHLGRAVAEGATLEEILDTMLISAALAESSTLSVALRKYKQLEGKLERKNIKG